MKLINRLTIDFVSLLFYFRLTYRHRILSAISGVFLYSSKDAYFTPVCTTEMIAFARANCYFEKLNTSLLGLSIDSNPSHLAWMHDIYCMTGIVLPFPIIADRNGSIARKYGMISNDISNTETVRNVFVIDDNGIVRVILVYPMNIGRFVPEILRIIQALQTTDCTNSPIPANWLPGQPVIQHPPRAFPLLQERLNHIKENNNGMNWYLAFQEPKQECLIEKTRDDT